MYNIYKLLSHIVTSHHSLVPYSIISIISLSYLHYPVITAAAPRRLSPMIGCPGWASPIRLRPFLAHPLVIDVNTLHMLREK